MELPTLNDELNAVVKEYKSFFECCQLENGYIHIVTQDNQVFDVRVGLGGWHAQTQEKYETFEALMMAVYPPFQKRFNDTLSMKLTQLLGQNIGEEEEDKRRE